MPFEPALHVCCQPKSKYSTHTRNSSTLVCLHMHSKTKLSSSNIWRHAFCNSSGIVKIHESEQTGRKVQQNLQASNLDKHIDKFCMLPRRICGAQLYHNAVAR